MRGLTSRLLIFNILLAVFPVGAFFFLGTYETQLLESQERAMVQQGRLLASALEGHNLEVEAEAILGRLDARNDSRLRVVDAYGRLLADSSSPSGSKENESPPANVQTNDPEDSVIYKTAVLPARVFRWFRSRFRKPEAPEDDAEFYIGKNILDGPEILAALAGRYGASTRISTGQRSVTLYSAIPIFQNNMVIGAVLVSRSTITILSDLYQLRLDIAKIFFISAGLAVVLSLLLARTVTVPVGRIRDQAEKLLDETGKLQDRFRPLSGHDEVADLSRALYRLSARLQERSAHMEDFMADLVHEMKNPIAGILSASELAERSAEKETLRFLSVIDREGRRIQRLLDDLRELISVDVRLDKGSRDLINMQKMLQTLVESYPAHRGEDISIVFKKNDNAEDTFFINANPDRLAQAILNLLDNAVSFSPENGCVEIALAAPRKGTLDISIADQGPGIGPDSRQKIFERWYTDRPEGEAAKHTGLGLAIVRGIAQGYGGGVSYRNREQGGAEFTLRFPSAPPPGKGVKT